MNWNRESQFENPPTGSHVARCIQLIDLGTQAITWNNQTTYKRQVRIVWELPEERMEGIYKPELKGKPFAVSRTYTQSLDSRATLRKDLENWRGKVFTKEDLTTFEPKSILGHPCLLNLVEKDGFVNVAGIAPCPKDKKTKKATCPKQINPSIYFSLEAKEFDGEVYDNLPEKTRAKIAASPEFKEITGHGEDSQPDSGTDGDGGVGGPPDSENGGEPF